MRHRILPLIPVTLLIVVQSGYFVAADNQVSTNDINLSDVLIKLNSPDFATRRTAQNQLRTLNTRQVSLLAGHAETSPAAETAIGCIQALEQHLIGDNPNLAWTAWEALETLQSSERHLVREETTWILSRHWKIRTKLATDELQKHGASIVLPDAAEAARIVHAGRRIGNPGAAINPRQQAIFIGLGAVTPAVQVFLTDSWQGDQAALSMLERIPGLQTHGAQALAAKPGAGRPRWFGGRNKNAAAPVVIFLISGHPLNQEAEEWVKGAFGRRIQERGEVMLGITAQGGIAGPGCRVESVVPFGSGDAAGLRAYDVITSVANRKITSFRDLVEELRNFSAGDHVEVDVRRIVNQGGRPVVGSLSIPVRLRSWKEYVEAINKAATEGPALVPAAVQ